MLAWGVVLHTEHRQTAKLIFSEKFSHDGVARLIEGGFSSILRQILDSLPRRFLDDLLDGEDKLFVGIFVWLIH
jgi:hypothetical protein